MNYYMSSELDMFTSTVLHKECNIISDIFLITSGINSNVHRLNDTLHTFKDIKRIFNHNNVIIILLEASPLTVEHRDILLEYCEYIVDFSKDKDISQDISDVSKKYFNEIIKLHRMSTCLLKHNIVFNRVFKVSGRYMFHIPNYKDICQYDRNTKNFAETYIPKPLTDVFQEPNKICAQVAPSPFPGLKAIHMVIYSVHRECLSMYVDVLKDCLESEFCINMEHMVYYYLNQKYSSYIHNIGDYDSYAYDYRWKHMHLYIYDNIKPMNTLPYWAKWPPTKIKSLNQN